MKGQALSVRLEDKFIPEPNSGCWLWTGSIAGGGYGQIFVEGKLRQAHRMTYELAHGPIADELELDHLCRVRSCVNPAHLEPVTGSENSLRGETGNATGESQRGKTHCPKGHLYDEKNTYRVVVRRKQGTYTERHCRLCHKEVMRKRRVAIS